MKYRKKPVEVEAVQVPGLLSSAAGSIYPVRADIFNETYELVT